MGCALQNIRDILLASSQDAYLAWLLCALTPWAKAKDPGKGNINIKKNLPMAATVAREGLKVDNKNISVIKDAILHYEEIIASKDALSNETQWVLNSTKGKQPALSREGLGMAIRRWGPHWRNSVMLSILVEVMDMEEDVGKFLVYIIPFKTG